MKKYIVLLISAAMISFGSCSSSVRNTLADRDNLAENYDASQYSISEGNTQSKALYADDLSADSNILIAYFSRVGNTDFDDDIAASTSASVVIDEERFGTTEYAANIIQKNVGGDIHLIETENGYSSDFDELTDINHKEMEVDYLPLLKESDLDILSYDTIFIGYPIWATDVSQAVRSFLNQYDLSAKTIIPFVTSGGSGFSDSIDNIRNYEPNANILDGLAIYYTDVKGAQSEVNNWISGLGL